MIKVEPTGTAGLMTGLAKLAGESIATQREIEQAERQATELRRVQWEKERTQLEHQWDIEAFNRSKMWDIEKMETASRLDFQREEKKRQKLLDELDTKKKAIDDSNYLTDEEKEIWKLRVETEVPMEKLLTEKAIFTPAYIEQTLGALASDDSFLDKEEAVNYASKRFGGPEKIPAEAMNIVNKRWPVGGEMETTYGEPLTLTEPNQPTQGFGVNPLDPNTASSILQEASGDKNKARQIAKQRGYTF
jgi:hypothetical protein